MCQKEIVNNLVPKKDTKMIDPSLERSFKTCFAHIFGSFKNWQKIVEKTLLRTFDTFAIKFWQKHLKFYDKFLSFWKNNKMRLKFTSFPFFCTLKYFSGSSSFWFTTSNVRLFLRDFPILEWFFEVAF